MTVNPSEPRFYEFAWSKADSVVLRVDSEGTSSNVCMAVSIQNVTVSKGLLCEAFTFYCNN